MKACFREVIYKGLIGKAFGSQDMALLYRNLCYGEACYNEVEMYTIPGHEVLQAVYQYHVHILLPATDNKIIFDC